MSAKVLVSKAPRGVAIGAGVADEIIRYRSEALEDFCGASSWVAVIGISPTMSEGLIMFTRSSP